MRDTGLELAFTQFTSSLLGRFNLKGLLLHGSFAKASADRWSDIDLIGITESGIVQNEKLEYGERQVELCLAPAHIIRMSFRSVNAANNNLFLNAFTLGQRLQDPQGAIEQLMAEAASVRKRGPASIGQSEYSSHHARLDKVIRRCGHNISRASGDPLLLRMAIILADQAFHKLILVYAKTTRLWTSSLPETLLFLKEEKPEFHQVCLNYMLAPDFQQQVTCLGAMLTLLEIEHALIMTVTSDAGSERAPAAPQTFDTL